MSTRDRRFADRIRELIDEGRRVAALESSSEFGSYIQDHVALHAWLVKVKNLVETVFGATGVHCQHLAELTKKYVQYAYQIEQIVGLLTGALDDLEKGFLAGQEQLVAGKVFDSILEESKHLLRAGFKDPAAILCRVVLEDALRRIAKLQGVDPALGSSKLNDELRRSSRYPQAQWRLIQSWLDIGNAAAHGNFAEYTQDDVRRLIDDLERFLGTELRQ